MEIQTVKTAVLREFIAGAQGKPENSHNRPMLERKALRLGFVPSNGHTNGYGHTMPETQREIAAEESHANPSRNVSASEPPPVTEDAPDRLPPLAPKERARTLAKRPRKAPAKSEKRSKPAKRTAKPASKPRANKGNFRTHDGPTPVFDVPTKSGEHRTTAPDETVREVRKLVKAGTSLRGMCAALTAGKFKTARGGKAWSPSSVQSIMRAL